MPTLKPVEKVSRKAPLPLTSGPPVQRRTTTLVIWGILGFIGAIVIAWLWGEKSSIGFFIQLSSWQESLAAWLGTPNVNKPQYYLLLPTVLCLGFAQLIMKISPQPKGWAKVTVILILLAVILRYLLWRSLFTLNFSSVLNGGFSVILFAIELIGIITIIFQFYLMLVVKDRRQAADRYIQKVAEGKFMPSVDILIPTYNEPVFILRRTIIGCQALDYSHKQIYILDDTNRIEVQQLANELGCYYLTRNDNRHAKAGNLNHALSKTKGELITVFDADFVPTQNFLQRTVGFFQNSKIALIQTPQSFYNSDPIAYNLGIQSIVPPEEEIFHRHIQPLKDGVGGTICVGTSFVVRRNALQEVGGFVTASISEDYFTGIRLLSKGYEVVYLNEKLSAGLAAENIINHIRQRLRWGRGTLQAFFIPENPLTIPGLSFLQRLANLEGIMQWFTSIFRVIFLLMPLAYTLGGIVPVRTTIGEWIYFFLPFYFLQLFTYSWLNHRSRSALMSEVYAIALCVPISLVVIKTLFQPFSERFKVTPKGTPKQQFKYNWTVASPLIVVFMLNCLGLFHILNIPGNTTIDPGILGTQRLALIWTAYNLFIIAIALLVMLDAPKPDVYEWFNLQKTVRLKAQDNNYSTWGLTSKISEIGAEIELEQIIDLEAKQIIELEISEETLTLQGRIVRIDLTGRSAKIKVLFESVTLPQHRQLITMLFCQPGQWEPRKTPGELHSLWLLLKVLLKSRFFFSS
jgi:cellulose synthase (UDP-forming)